MTAGRPGSRWSAIQAFKCIVALSAGERVIAKINPILRGWVNYFRVGNAARCFSIVRSWVDSRVLRSRRLTVNVRQDPRPSLCLDRYPVTVMD
jgi:hypothetical protein